MIKLLQYMKANNDIAHIATDYSGTFWPVCEFVIDAGIVTVDVVGKRCNFYVDDICMIKSDNTGEIIYD